MSSIIGTRLRLQQGNNRGPCWGAWHPLPCKAPELRLFFARACQAIFPDFVSSGSAKGESIFYVESQKPRISGYALLILGYFGVLLFCATWLSVFLIFALLSLRRHEPCKSSHDEHLQGVADVMRALKGARAAVPGLQSVMGSKNPRIRLGYGYDYQYTSWAIVAYVGYAYRLE